MEGYTHSLLYYYFDLNINGKIRRHIFTHLIEAIRIAEKEKAPIDIYNNDGILMYSLPIHEF